jgi:predicted MPP superfamily phosphohydrolase
LFESFPLFLQGLFAALITLGAGGSLFVFTLNRKLSHVEFLHRRVLLGGVLGILLCALAFGLAVWLNGIWLRLALLLPGSVLLIALVGEVRRLVQRRRHRGTLPASQEDLHFDGETLVSQPRQKWHPVTTTDLRVTRYEIVVPLLPASAGTPQSVKVVQLSDFHFSPRLPFAYFRSAVERAIQEDPDLVLLTGDFVTFAEDAKQLPQLFAGLSGRLGVFATLGNHDYWAGCQPTLAALERAGVRLIANDCHHLPLPGGLSLSLSGCDDPWGAPPWQPPQLNPRDLNLIISHSADNIYRLVRHPFDAVFSGHFHAGQVRLPGFGSLVLPSRFGRRFDHGHFQFQNASRPGLTHLFVSAGVGSATPLLRIYCQPDIFVVNFSLAQSNDGLFLSGS